MNQGYRQDPQRFGSGEHRSTEMGRYGRDRTGSDESRFEQGRMYGGGRQSQGGYNPRYAPEFYAGQDDWRGGDTGRYGGQGQFGSQPGEGREGGQYGGQYGQGQGGVHSGGYSRGQDTRDFGRQQGSEYQSGMDYGSRSQFGGGFGSDQRYGGSQRTGQYGNYLGYGGAEQGGRYGTSGGSMYGEGMGGRGAGFGGRSGSEWGFNDSWRSMDSNRSRRKGPKGYTRSDERIKDDVCERLMSADEVDLDEVSIEVQNGKVKLEGTVPERRMKHTIEDTACNCMGVRDVENNLRIADRDSESGDGESFSTSKRGASGRSAGGTTSHTRQ